MGEIPETSRPLQDEAFRLLTIAQNKFAARPEDREASAKNILTYAVYLCAGLNGREETEAHFRKALNAAS